MPKWQIRLHSVPSSTYGETPTLPKMDRSEPDHDFALRRTKFVGELTQVFGRVYGLENASVRYFNVFGPRQDPTSQCPAYSSRFMLAVLKSEPLIHICTAMAKQSRDFTYMDTSGRNAACRRGCWRVRQSLQRRHRRADHAEPSRRAPRKNHGQKAPGEIRSASRRRYVRFEADARSLAESSATSRASSSKKASSAPGSGTNSPTARSDALSAVS